jgi:hypothetical protein
MLTALIRQSAPETIKSAFKVFFCPGSIAGVCLNVVKTSFIKFLKIVNEP